MIQANSIRVIDDARQCVNFTIISDGQVYRWHGNTPRLTGQSLQDYLSEREETFLTLIAARESFRDTHSDTAVLPVTLDEHRAAKVAEMSATTYAYIASHMPDWRLNRWRRYWDLAQKVAAGGTLDPVEQAEYEVFPDPGESHADCVQYVPVALQWVAACIAAHSQAGVRVYQAATVEAVQAVAVDYPVWPL